MQFSKEKIMNALKKVSVDNGNENKKLDKEGMLEKLGSFKPKTNEKSPFLNKLQEFNKKLGKPSDDFATKMTKKNLFESMVKRTLMEADSKSPVNGPNSFRLILDKISMDLSHVKFQLTRSGLKVLVEIVYPNANGNITVKVSTQDTEDILAEVSLEDKEYVNGFSTFVVGLVDRIVSQKKSESSIDNNAQTIDAGTASAPTTGYPPTWEGGTGNTTLESMMNKFKSLFEAPKPEDKETDANPDSASFGEQDFSMDAAPDVTEGGFPNSQNKPFDPAAMNADGGDTTPGATEDDTYSTLVDRQGWKRAAIDTMLDLISKSTADNMQPGGGVILTKDEVKNGTVGIQNSSDVDVLKKFAELYNLDGLELKDKHLDEIEDKLALNDGTFDSWFQSKLPEFTGQEADVDMALNNDLFNSINDKGSGLETDSGDVGAGGIGSSDFGGFLDNVGSMGGDTTGAEGDLTGNTGDVDSLPVEPVPVSGDVNAEDQNVEERDIAEEKVGKKELKEFPNL